MISVLIHFYVPINLSCKHGCVCMFDVMMMNNKTKPNQRFQNKLSLKWISEKKKKQQHSYYFLYQNKGHSDWRLKVLLVYLFSHTGWSRKDDTLEHCHKTVKNQDILMKVDMFIIE